MEHLSGRRQKAEIERIYSDLKSNRPTIKLLYVTPEKLHKNHDLKDILESLYARNKISRWVSGYFTRFREEKVGNVFGMYK